MTFKPRLFLLLISLAVTRVFGQVPVITNVDKYVAGNAKRVTISGSNFGANASNLVVWFGAARATTILTATDQTIEVLVPPGATYESITVTDKTTGKTAWSGGEFMLSYGGTAPIAITSLVAQTDLAAESGLFDVCLCDLDNDGKNDVGTANQGNGATAPASSVALFLNTTPVGGAFTFAAKTTFLSGIKSLHIKCGDLDGDGKKDLVVTEADPGNRVFVLRNISTTGNLLFSSQSFTLTGKAPKRIEISDLDLDGKPEMIITDQNTSNNNFIIFRNTSTSGAISFGSPTFIPGPTGARSSDGLAVQDLDGDRRPEIVISQYLTANSNVYVYKNESTAGSFRFDKVTTLPLAGTPVNVRVGDIDGDLKPDIVATQLLASQISVFLNISSPTQIQFGNPTTVSTDLVPWGLDFGDLDGDGKLDVVVASLTGTGAIDPKSLTILSNTSAPGAVSFTPKIIRTTTYANRHVVVGDIDGDSKPDITYTSVDDNSRSILASKVSFFRNQSCITPKVTPEGPLVVCAGFPLTLEGTEAPGATYAWKKDGGATVGTTSTFTPLVSGVYTLDVIKASEGCVKTSNGVNVTIGAGTATPLSFNNNSPLCEGGTLNIKVTSAGDSFKWTGPAAFNETNTSGEITRTAYQPSFAGRYEVEVTSGGCIAAKGSTLVETISLPSFSVSYTGSDVICGSDTKQLLAFPSDPDFTYQWKDANGDIPSATTDQLTVSASGTYSFKAKSISYTGCPEVTATAVSVTKAPTPAVSFTAPDETCKDTPASFTNTSVLDAGAGPSYKWDFGDAGTATTQNATHVYTALGSFTAKLTASYRNDACATSFTKPITVSVAPAATITAPNNNFDFCEGGTLTLSVVPTFSEYLWVETNTAGATLDIHGSGIYTVKVKDAIGCIITASKTILAKPSPALTASATPNPINLGEQTILNIEESYDNYSWTPVESLDLPATKSPTAKPLITTTYTISVLGANGCVGKDSVTVEVIGDNPLNLLKIANFFSPNGDDINKTWMVEPKSIAETCGVVIFDEKGSKVYESKGYMNDWDGTSNGKQLPNGVYYYTIRCDGDSKSKAGSITILR